MLPAYLDVSAKIETTDEEEIFSVFSTAARSLLESLEFRVASASNRGKQVRFRLGQGLHPSSDLFVRTVIQPAVGHYVSSPVDWTIAIFNYFNMVVILTIIQLYQYVGTWNLLMYYVWPSEWSTAIRDMVYLSIGIIIAFISQRFYSLDKTYEYMENDWKDGLPESFAWKRKLDSYARETLSFFGYVFFWEGAWDFTDKYLFPESAIRDGIYVLVPLFVVFVLEEILCPESMYYMASLCSPKKEELKQAQQINDTLDTERYVGYDPYQVHDNEESSHKSPFEPGQKLSPATDWFIREVIQPTMRGYISPAGDMTVRVFSYVNNILLISIVTVFQWVGFWNLLTTYWLWANTRIRDGVYAGVGFFLIFVSMRFFNSDLSYDDMEDSWHNGIPNTFGWDRKFIRYCREAFSTFGFLFCWVGSWDFIDTQTIDDSMWRDLTYVGVSLISGFFFGYIFSIESLYYMAAQCGGNAVADFVENDPLLNEENPTSNSLPDSDLTLPTSTGVPIRTRSPSARTQRPLSAKSRKLIHSYPGPFKRNSQLQHQNFSQITERQRKLPTEPIDNISW